MELVRGQLRYTQTLSLAQFLMSTDFLAKEFPVFSGPWPEILSLLARF